MSTEMDNEATFALSGHAELIEDIKPPVRLEMMQILPPVSEEIQAKHAWNPEDTSPNIFVKGSDIFTCHRFNAIQSTDCIRGKTGFSKGFHVWEIQWSTKCRGTTAIVGVATQEAPLNAEGYVNLVGRNDQSWGWNLVNNKLYHDCKNTTSTSLTDYPPPSLKLKPNKTFVAPSTFQFVLDMDEGNLAFVANGRYLGVAFRGLKNMKLYPIVSSVWGGCKVTMKYIGSLYCEPLPLTFWCRRVIRQCIGKERKHRVSELNIPSTVKDYLMK